MFKYLWRWFRILISGKPHIVVGQDDAPYMLRWYVLPRNRFFNVYIHKFVHSDDDRAAHDHPWPWVSIMLRGRYIEHIWPDPAKIDTFHTIYRSAPSIAIRKATHTHKVELYNDADGKPIPCWTLVLTRNREREWGFWCQQGFIDWRIFTSAVDGQPTGKTGRGCGEGS